MPWSTLSIIVSFISVFGNDTRAVCSLIYFILAVYNPGSISCSPVPAPVIPGHAFGVGFDREKLLPNLGGWGHGSEPAQQKGVFTLFPSFLLLSQFLEVTVNRRV